jgi:hypothetical protein
MMKKNLLGHLLIQAVVYFIFVFVATYFLIYPDGNLKRTLFLTLMATVLYTLFMYFGNRFLSKRGKE